RPIRPNRTCKRNIMIAKDFIPASGAKAFAIMEAPAECGATVTAPPGEPASSAATPGSSPAAPVPSRGTLLGVAAGATAMVCVGGACVPAVLAVIGPLLEGSRPEAKAIAAALVVTCGAGLVQGLGRADATGVAWAVVVFGCEAAFTLLAIPVLTRHGPWGVSV